MFRTRNCLVFFWPVLASLIAPVNQCQGQDSIEITPKLTPGTTYYLELDERVEDKWEAGPTGPAHVDQHQWIRGVIRTLEEPYAEGNYIAQLTFDRVVFKGKVLDGEEVVYDSDQDEQAAPRNPARMIWRFIVAKPFILLITEEGRGSGIAGLRALYKTLEGQLTDNPVLDAVMGGFSEDAARFTWGHFPHALYAFASVKKGDTWSVPLRAYDIYLGETQYDLKCRLDDIKTVDGKKMGTVKFSAALTKPADARGGMLKGLLRLELQSGKFEGTALYDVAQHEFVRIDAKTIMNISATLDDAEEGTSELTGMKRTVEETRRILSLEERAKEKESRQQVSR